ncbi:hypothetical protein GJ496_008542 [Pomphorhynchus laevis]|nr:hypothetical protein GJ496_008542 [Pomphorhynchus laevis]
MASISFPFVPSFFEMFEETCRKGHNQFYNQYLDYRSVNYVINHVLVHIFRHLIFLLCAFIVSSRIIIITCSLFNSNGANLLVETLLVDQQCPPYRLSIWKDENREKDVFLSIWRSTSFRIDNHSGKGQASCRLLLNKRSLGEHSVTVQNKERIQCSAET